ncbi:hypothetical protein [Frigidibacter sp. SD6-1]|uniref:hypothetical protein n=1 Tax=Frigidibacter sp. SD6-1 TaxID=3032581 RepID=UPI0024DFC32D|nr:hypothetical protein [Frigidibacter sp. SD6-1]
MNDQVAFAVARNNTIGIDILWQLAQHPNRSVRQVISGSARLSAYPELMKQLAFDEDEGVRVGCYRRDMPQELREEMEKRYGYSLD